MEDISDESVAERSAITKNPGVIEEKDLEEDPDDTTRRLMMEARHGHNEAARRRKVSFWIFVLVILVGSFWKC